MERQIGVLLNLSKEEKVMLEKDAKELGLSQTGLLRLLLITWHKSKDKELTGAKND